MINDGVLGGCGGFVTALSALLAELQNNAGIHEIGEDVEEFRKHAFTYFTRYQAIRRHD